jgi:two-component system, chemotaxis family, chemotaxis protein CheY
MPQKILIVDDDPENREMLTLLLCSEGYTVICAEDGCAGLNQARKEGPQLILTDLNMPNLNGVEMIRTIRAQPEMSDLPIIACTAHMSGIAALEALNAGANHAAYKPIGFNALLALVTKLLSKTVVTGILIRIAAAFID